jgi:hypothetical protein
MKTLTEIKKAIDLCLNSTNCGTECPYLRIGFCTKELTSDIIKIIDEYEKLKTKNKYCKVNLNELYGIYAIKTTERNNGKIKAEKEYKLKGVLKDINLCLHGDCDGCYFQRKGKPNCVDGLYNELVKVIYENNK